MPEKDLYMCVHDYLELRYRERLKPALGELLTVSAVTDRAGGSATGHWTKPDLALAALWRPKYGLKWTLDLHGFEVKTQTNCTPAAVHEALSHTALVNYASLVWHCPGWGDRDRTCSQIMERCERFGIGLITLVEPSDSDTFVVRIPPQRHEPSHEAIDEFIETRLPEDKKSQLSSWIAERR